MENYGIVSYISFIYPQLYYLNELALENKF